MGFVHGSTSSWSPWPLSVCVLQGLTTSLPARFWSTLVPWAPNSCLPGWRCWLLHPAFLDCVRFGKETRPFSHLLTASPTELSACSGLWLPRWLWHSSLLCTPNDKRSWKLAPNPAGRSQSALSYSQQLSQPLTTHPNSSWETLRKGGNPLNILIRRQIGIGSVGT